MKWKTVAVKGELDVWAHRDQEGLDPDSEVWDFKSNQGIRSHHTPDS